MIAIYSDTESYGGVEMLVVRFARHLRRRGIPFAIITKQGTRVAHELSWATQLDPKDPSGWPGQIDQVLFPNVCALKRDLPWSGLERARVLGWLVHPTEIFTSLFPVSNRLLAVAGYPAARLVRRLLRRHDALVVQLLRVLVQSSGLVVMDGATRRSLQYFFPDVRGESVLLPIPAPCETDLSGMRLRGSVRSFGYLGRMDEHKYSALAPLINTELRSLARRGRVELHLIAEGSLLPAVERLCRENSIELHSHGFLPNEAAKTLLREKTQLGICMGTAALDVASSGHPCVIIDPALRTAAPPQRGFRFVHEIEDFTLGEFRDFAGYRSGPHSFEEVLSIVGRDDSVGLQGRRYVATRHDPDTVFDRLLVELSRSRVFGWQIAQTATELARSYRSIDEGVRSAFNRVTRMKSLLWRAASGA